MPAHLRIAAAAGIGLLLAFIGLRAAGIVAPSPATFVTAGHLGRSAIVFGVGLVVTLALLARNSPLALIGGIVLATIAAGLLGETRAPAHIASWPDFSLLGRADLAGALRWKHVPALLAIALTDLFDSLSFADEPLLEWYDSGALALVAVRVVALETRRDARHLRLRLRDAHARLQPGDRVVVVRRSRRGFGKEP